MERGVCFAAFCYGLQCVDDGPVIPATEQEADGGLGGAGLFTKQVHGHLSGQRDSGGSAGLEQAAGLHVVKRGDFLADVGGLGLESRAVREMNSSAPLGKRGG